MNIDVEKLVFHYNTLSIEQQAPALRNVSFSLSSGECLALVGPSGSGKSTLVQQLNGLLTPSSGAVRINGNIIQYEPRPLREIRKNIGLVFQFPEAQIFESTVFDEVAFAARKFDLKKDDIPDLVDNALKNVGLNPSEFKQLDPLKLSGGESRLVSIASVLVIDPQWLILDEPTLGLDIAHRQCITDLIEERKRNNRGVLLITHDMDIAYKICPRTIALMEGVVSYDGDTRTLLNSNLKCDELGLITPDILQLQNFISENTETNGIDQSLTDDVAMLNWLAVKSEQQKKSMCSVLKHFCEDKTTHI